MDGTNLFHGMAELLAEGQYIDFASILAVVNQELPIAKVKFYASYLRMSAALSPAARLKTKAQIFFLDHARTLPNITFYPGYFGRSGREKGVDVHMAVDIVKDGYENLCDEIVVMSGDDDFLYPVEVAAAARQVHVVAFAARYPRNLTRLSSKRIVLDYNHYFRMHMLLKLGQIPHRLKIVDLDPTAIKDLRQ